MAKASKKRTFAQDPRGIRDALFMEMFQDAEKIYNAKGLTIGSEETSKIMGLPIKQLAKCYLFQSNIFPLSRMTVIVGIEGSSKSSLLFDIYQQFDYWGGFWHHLDVELKDSPDLRRSFLGYETSQFPAADPCPTMDEWQQKLTFRVNGFKALCEKRGGPGASVPHVFGVDSMMAKLTADTAAQIRQNGSPSRGFPAEALYLNNYLKFISGEVMGWPIAVVAINHLKPAKDPRTGLPIRNIPGGAMPKFQETIEIEMRKRSKPFQRVGYEGIPLEIVTRKCGMGGNDRHLEVDMLWRFDEQYRQHTWFDWDGATIELLLGLSATDRKSLDQIIDLHDIRGQKKCWSAALGYPDSDSAVSYSELGAALHARPDLLVPIYPILKIRPRQFFEPSVVYREEMFGDTWAREVQEAVEHLQLGADPNGPPATPSAAEPEDGTDE